MTREEMQAARRRAIEARDAFLVAIDETAARLHEGREAAREAREAHEAARDAAWAAIWKNHERRTRG